MIPPVLELLLPLIHHFGMGLVEDSRSAGHGNAAGLDFDSQPQAQGVEGLELVALGMFGQ